MAITFNDNLDISTGKPLDKKYYSGSPYTSISNANNNIPLAVRHIGLTININNQEYWYKNGINDEHLIKKILYNDISISGLTDVELSGSTEGQVLTYSGGTWVNADAGGGGSSASFGDVGEIPFINDTSDDFDYSTNFKYTDSGGLIMSNTIQTNGNFSIGTEIDNMFSFNVYNTTNFKDVINLEKTIQINGTSVDIGSSSNRLRDIYCRNINNTGISSSGTITAFKLVATNQITAGSLLNCVKWPTSTIDSITGTQYNGAIVYDSDLDVFKFMENGSWVTK